MGTNSACTSGGCPGQGLYRVTGGIYCRGELAGDKEGQIVPCVFDIWSLLLDVCYFPSSLFPWQWHAATLGSLWWLSPRYLDQQSNGGRWSWAGLRIWGEFGSFTWSGTWGQPHKEDLMGEVHLEHMYDVSWPVEMVSCHNGFNSDNSSLE